MVFGLDPAWGMLLVPLIAFTAGFGWAGFGIVIARSLKSIDNFSYVTIDGYHAAVPGGRHLLPDRPACPSGPRWPPTSTRSTTVCSSCATRAFGIELRAVALPLPGDPVLRVGHLAAGDQPDDEEAGDVELTPAAPPRPPPARRCRRRAMPSAITSVSSRPMRSPCPAAAAHSSTAQVATPAPWASRGARTPAASSAASIAWAVASAAAGSSAVGLDQHAQQVVGHAALTSRSRRPR